MFIYMGLLILFILLNMLFLHYFLLHFAVDSFCLNATVINRHPVTNSDSHVDQQLVCITCYFCINSFSSSIILSRLVSSASILSIFLAA